MKNSLFTIIAFLFLINNSIAQLSKTWKPQIYVGFNKVFGGKQFIKSENYDLNYVTKTQWLFNIGCTHSKYGISPKNQSFPGNPLSTNPKINLLQFNLSAGKRFDLLPKWSIAMYSGLSFTHYKYANAFYNHTIKFNSYVPVSLSGVGMTFTHKKSFGIHLNGEISFYLCENMTIQAGYVLDINKALYTGGFTVGGRVGLIKQKYGTRNISKIRF